MTSVQAELQVEILALSESQMPRDFRRQPHSGVCGGGVNRETWGEGRGRAGRAGSRGWFSDAF